MSEQLLEQYVKVQVAVTQAGQRMRARLGEEHGQTAAEYMGIIFLVALVIFGIVSTDIDNDIKTRVDELVGNIGKGTEPSK